MNVLPDILKSNLKVIFCGTAVGKKSAKLKAYYATASNKFWTVLCKIGLTPHKIEPKNFATILRYGIGLTDLSKLKFGNDSEINHQDFNTTDLRQKIKTITPQVLAFNGKKAAEIFLNRKVEYGRQEETIDKTAIFVLPSTSGAANGYWEEKYWQELAFFLKKLAS